MVENRGHSPKEPVRRIRGKIAESEQPRGGLGCLASGSRPLPADARPPALSDPAPSVVDVVREVTASCGHAEVEPGVSMNEALSDPKLRASAAKWRSGNETRRVTALCARLLNGLQSIKPSWLEGLAAAPEPAPVQPLPMREARVGPHEPPNRLMMVYYWFLAHVKWKTLCLVLLIMCFPKVFALLVTVVIRLLVRALLALVGRLLTEVGRELREMLFQVTLATSSTEESLLQYLETFFTVGPAPPPVIEAAAPRMQSVPADSHVCPLQAPCPHQPNPPWSFVSCVLLLADLLLRLRPMGGAG